MLLALVVAVVPGGDNAAEAVLAAISIIFLALIAFACWQLFRQNQFTYMGLSERHRAVFLVALGAIALMIAAADELTATGLGILVWLAVLGLSGYALYSVWIASRSY